MIKKDQIITAAEAAEILGCKEKSMSGVARSGYAHAVKTPGTKAFRYYLSEILKYKKHLDDLKHKEKEVLNKNGQLEIGEIFLGKYKRYISCSSMREASDVYSYMYHNFQFPRAKVDGITLTIAQADKMLLKGHLSSEVQQATAEKLRKALKIA